MIKIHRFQNANTTIWSGGKTTELFIYPEKSPYSERKFDFRISTATIEIENSDFTPLPSYHRVLAILEGNLELSHQGKYTKQLQTFESDAFHGSWKTSSKGKVRDLNVIYNEYFDLKFNFIEILEQTILEKNSDFLFLLILNKSVEIEGFELGKYDLLEVNQPNITIAKDLKFFQIELTRV